MCIELIVFLAMVGSFMLGCFAAKLPVSVSMLTASIVGALVMMSLTSGMNLMSIDISLQYIVRGAVLVLAVIVDRATRKNR